jgi:hypothetical protein
MRGEGAYVVLGVFDAGVATEGHPYNDFIYFSEITTCWNVGGSG